MTTMPESNVAKEDSVADDSTCTDVDVVIAGAGIAGALFANLLARSEQGRNLGILLVEPNPFKANYSAERFDARVVALTEQSRRMLDELNVWGWVAARRCCPYLTMSVRDAEGTGQVDFDCAEARQLSLGHIVENSLLVEGLLGQLQQHTNVAIRQAAIEAVDSRGEEAVCLTLSGSGEVAAGKVRARLLVAADGALSPVRSLCSLTVREWEYGHKAIVTTITTESGHGHRARQWFSPDGPLAFLPLQNRDGGTNQCSIVWSQKDARAEELLALDGGAFCRALTASSEAALGKVVHCERRFSFPLRQRHAVDYTSDGVALIGDAAHTIHPLAGQGINLGFKDAGVLAEELAWGLRRGLPLGSRAVLGRYQRRRKPDNLAMMALMEGFKRLFESEQPLLRLLRNDGMSGVNRLGPLKNMLARQAMGL